MAKKVCIEREAGDIVGAAEAAEILGVKTPQISRWLKAGKMPESFQTLKATEVWLRADVLEMKAKRG